MRKTQSKPKTEQKRKGATHKRQTLPGNERSFALDGDGLSEGLFRSLVNHLEAGLAVVRTDGTILYANQRFASMIDRTGKGLLGGQALRKFIPFRDWKSLSEALSAGSLCETKGTLKILDTEASVARSIQVSFLPLREQSAIVGVLATEVTKIEQADKALERSKASVRSLSSRLLQLQDEERRRMARDLHDITGQELAIAIMSVDQLQKKPAGDIFESLAEVSAQLRKIESEIRTFSYVLHPPLLDEMGLRSAIFWYIEGFSKRTGVRVEADASADLPRLDLEIETALFRVIQESLTNVVRHSESKRAWVQCAANSRQLKIVIQDEGIGLDAKRIGAGQKAGVGIQSMTDRMKLLGGSLEIHSSKHGTRVTAAVPLSKARATGEAGEGPETEKIELLPRGVAHTDGRKRILIADDHVVARQGIKSLLGDQPDLEICGEAENGADAVAKARQLVPDLLILDLNMPHMGGISAADQIRKIGLEMKILIYTTHSYPGLDRMARNSGCNGFVLKSNASNDLIRGVRAVLANSEFYVGGAPQPRVKSARSQG